MYTHCIQSDRVSQLIAVVDVLLGKTEGFTGSGVVFGYIPGLGLFYGSCKAFRFIFYHFEVLHV